MHNLGFKIVREGEAKVACQRFDGAAPLCSFALYLLGTEISSVDEAWLVKRKEQRVLLTNIDLSIT